MTINTDQRQVDIVIDETFIHSAGLALTVMSRKLPDATKAIELIIASLMNKADAALLNISNPPAAMIQMPIYELWMIASALKVMSHLVPDEKTIREAESTYLIIRHVMTKAGYDLDVSMTQFGIEL
jgi:hypothetical protein